MFGVQYSALPLFILFDVFKFGASFSGFKAYHQPCSNNETCYGSDFRLVCQNSTALCQCSSFYYWNDTFQECHSNLSHLTDWFNHHKERHIADDLNTESQVVFLSIALSGIVSLTLGLALSILCVMYACMYRDVVESPALPIRVKGVTAHAQKMNTSGDGTQKTK
uniref:Uncharacterized protein n=1 Tax=Cacopsylla melanoneura TaxID=428564 RepID=A0A8D8Y969_9HEMI